MALCFLSNGCVDFSENDHMSGRVGRWRVIDETTHEVLSEGCSQHVSATKIAFKASPGQHIAEEAFGEEVDKSQKDAIPSDDDAFWCSTRSDASRERSRGIAREACASTDPGAPATLDDVELIDPQPSGLQTSSIGYVLHLTVTGSGELRLVFKAPPCSAPGSRPELVILPP
jgi:hypothetical protein